MRSASARPSVLHGLAGAGLAAVVALPLVAGGSLPWAAAAEPAPRPVAAPAPAAPETEAAAAEHRQLRQHVAATRAAQRAAERAAAEQAAAEQAAAERAAAEKAAADRASRSARSGDPKSIARAMLAERGQADQFGCLEKLWTKESGWNHRARNASSGAYGIPQSLPAGKMSTAGGDWQTNPATQIRWGLGYIGDRYGSPCAAWRHSQANNWY